MKNNINYLVEECLKQHEGGEKFFDAIDEKLRNDNLLLTMMLGRILEKEKFDYIIVSGKFGVVFKNFCTKHFDEELAKNIIVINGSLRNEDITVEFPEEYNINNKSLVFIDDSFFLGRTRDKIKNSIENKGGNLLYTYVFYDGSKIKDSTVYSFYRYFDNFN